MSNSNNHDIVGLSSLLGSTILTRISSDYLIKDLILNEHEIINMNTNNYCN